MRGVEGDAERQKGTFDASDIVDFRFGLWVRARRAKTSPAAL